MGVSSLIRVSMTIARGGVSPLPPSRSYKKNDSCHVEQKNWAVVRRVIGYDRFSSKAAFKALEDVYTLLRLYINFFQPVLKLVGKTRHGAKVYKVYGTARTPYQRLLRQLILYQLLLRQLSFVSLKNFCRIIPHNRKCKQYILRIASK
ncbi:hypothetical protein ES703_118564 [subsurface metagenome]